MLRGTVLTYIKPNVPGAPCTTTLSERMLSDCESTVLILTLHKKFGDLNIFQKTDPSIQEAKWKENTWVDFKSSFLMLQLSLRELPPEGGSENLTETTLVKLAQALAKTGIAL